MDNYEAFPVFLFSYHHMPCFNCSFHRAKMHRTPQSADLNKKTRLYGNRVQSEKANRYFANSTRLFINIHYLRKFHTVDAKKSKMEKTDGCKGGFYDLQTSDTLTKSFHRRLLKREVRLLLLG